MVSSAVDAQNPEVLEARRLAIPVIPRGELLAELMRLKYGIAVAGSHGKTTTTSMTATILIHAGLDPRWLSADASGRWAARTRGSGKRSFLVVESDESDGSFLKLSPILAMVTNIDREHLDHYSGHRRDSRRRLLEFVNKVPFYGAAIVCLDDENVQQILPGRQSPRHHLRHGRAGDAGDRAVLLRPSVERRSACGYRGEDLGEFHVACPGRSQRIERNGGHCHRARAGDCARPDSRRTG